MHLFAMAFYATPESIQSLIFSMAICIYARIYTAIGLRLADGTGALYLYAHESWLPRLGPFTVP